MPSSLPLVEEGKLISRALLQATLNGADVATWVMATGVAMRRGPGLQVCHMRSSRSFGISPLRG